MNKLFKNPLYLFIFGATATSLIGYLINQLPTIPDFPYKNESIIAAVIIVTLLIAWGTYQQAQQQPENAPEQIYLNLRPQLLKEEETKVKQRLKDSLLEDSLHLSLIIELDKQEQLKEVGRNPLLPYKISTNQNTSSPQQTHRMIDVLYRADINGKLLILGQPGGGKTITLLNLAKELLERAKQDDRAPMPFIFELSAWQDDNANIFDWLIIQLKQKYHLKPGIIRFWLEQGDILPLFDGLDELGLKRQKKCIVAINQYLRENPTRHLVVCSREEEYHTGEEQLLELNGAVSLQQLSDGQIQNYLYQLNRDDLWQEIQRNAEFSELAKTPLLLSMMAVAYQGRAIQTKQELFDAYIDHKFGLPSINKREPKRKKTMHFLVFLAKRLQETQTEFLIENIQPYWLQKPQQKWLYGLILGLIIGLILAPITGVTFGLKSHMYHIILITGPTIGMALRHDSIQPIEAIQLSLTQRGISIFIREIFLGLILGLIIGLIIGLILVLSLVQINGLNLVQNNKLILLLISGLIFGLIGGLIFGLIGGLIGGLKAELKTKFTPNQGIWASFKNTFLITVVFSILFFSNQIWLKPFLLKFIKLNEVTFILNFLQCLTFSTVLFIGGGLACVQHFSLRFVLWCNGYIPWNYAQFLNRAAQRRLIQQVGGRYRFIHRLLLDHFADMRY